MSENMFEVENTGWGLKEALPEYLPAQDRSPSLYAIPFPLSEVPLKSQPSCFGSVLPQVHHSQLIPSKLPWRTQPPRTLPQLSTFPVFSFPSIGSSKAGTRSLPSLRPQRRSRLHIPLLTSHLVQMTAVWLLPKHWTETAQAKVTNDL